MSLAIIRLLIKSSFFHSRTRLSVLRLAIVLDLVGLMGAFIAGSFRKLEWSVYVVLLVFATVTPARRAAAPAVSWCAA
ncbi:hypothetical protein GUJ93_ZPchr0006g43457 [Zizania palustris]|uniref:Uncharacterized protein n=1 Tax=Zizania palustris TaxID=103762 RepID=A0A8J5SK24_ZIZPA|nr:hypothetical protein GUJ93_ZPchr0006g43457 [Zizania palustris]